MSQLLEEAQQKWKAATFRNCGEAAAGSRVLMLQPPAATYEQRVCWWTLWPLSKMPHRGTLRNAKTLHPHQCKINQWSEVNVTPQKWEMSLSHDEQSTSLVKLLGSALCVRANVNLFSHRYTRSTAISILFFPASPAASWDWWDCQFTEHLARCSQPTAKNSMSNRTFGILIEVIKTAAVLDYQFPLLYYKKTTTAF